MILDDWVNALINMVDHASEMTTIPSTAKFYRYHHQCRFKSHSLSSLVKQRIEGLLVISLAASISDHVSTTI